MMKTGDEFEAFEKNERQLHVFYREVSALSRKSPNDAVNKFKLGLINACLRGLNLAIGNPLEGFESFEESLLPSNSDVGVVLGQYVATVYAFRIANTGKAATKDGYFWIANGQPMLKTREPEYFKFQEK